MLNDFLVLMKSELILTLIIFVLLFIKISRNDGRNDSLLNIINALLFLNLAAGFFMNRDGALFNEMFRTNGLVQTEKNILNLGVFIISLQANGWLKNHSHIPEFYILL